MAYDPSIYNPYGFQQNPYQQQPLNGLSFIDSINDLDTLKMPPGSVSAPYFLKDEDKFVIVTFDKAGGSTRELFSFKKEVIENPNETVTKADLDAFKAEIMEAINGKHAIPAATATAETQQPATATPADPATRVVQYDLQPDVPEQPSVSPVRR